MVDRPGASGVLIPTEDGVWILDVYVLTRVRDDGEITGRIELPYADAGSDLNPGTYGDGAIWIGIRPEDV